MAFAVYGLRRKATAPAWEAWVTRSSVIMPLAATIDILDGPNGGGAVHAGHHHVGENNGDFLHALDVEREGGAAVGGGEHAIS
jgi:hypothetical protein